MAQGAAGLCGGTGRGGEGEPWALGIVPTRDPQEPKSCSPLTSYVGAGGGFKHPRVIRKAGNLPHWNWLQCVSLCTHKCMFTC